MSLNIGIDGDIDKSGVAIKDLKTREIKLLSLSFFELLEFLKANEGEINLIRVEAGYLNEKANFHYKGVKTSVAAQIGSRVGANWQVCKLIVEMCKYLGLKYEEVRPLKKHWKGTNGKITHEEIKMLCPQLKETKSNQETRDALLLIL